LLIKKRKFRKENSEKQNYYIKVEAYAGKKESGTFELSFESKQIEVSKSPVKVEVGEKNCRTFSRFPKSISM